MTQIKTGTRVRVVGMDGGLFYSANRGKVGVVTRLTRNDEIVHVRFDDGVEDYGRPKDVEVVSVISPTTGAIVVGSKVKVIRSMIFLHKYVDQIGEVYQVNGSTIYVQFDNGCDYGHISELELVVTVAARRVEHADMVEGMKVRLLNDGDGHSHWGFRKGHVYNCVKGAPVSTRGESAAKNWANWIWEVVEEAPVPTLDSQLAALRAELEGVKAEKAAAEAEVKAAQAKVDGVEARRIALVGRLSKHGIQFIGESLGQLNGLQAHEAGILKVGTKLLTVRTANYHEHTNGNEYAVTRIDANDSVCTYKLESNDGAGHWLTNHQLAGYDVVA